MLPSERPAVGSINDASSPTSKRARACDQTGVHKSAQEAALSLGPSSAAVTNGCVPPKNAATAVRYTVSPTAHRRGQAPFRRGVLTRTCPLRQLQKPIKAGGCFRIYRPSILPRSGLGSCDRRHTLPHHFLDTRWQF